jgi:hypothetical protein
VPNQLQTQHVSPFPTPTPCPAHPASQFHHRRQHPAVTDTGQSKLYKLFFSSTHRQVDNEVLAVLTAALEDAKGRGGHVCQYDKRRKWSDTRPQGKHGLLLYGY